MLEPLKQFLARHPNLEAFVQKIMRDNLGMLASVLAWTLLTSIVPIAVGLIAISSLFLRSEGAQRNVVLYLSRALQDVLSTQDLNNLVKLTVQHQGLILVLGILGTIWGGSAIGGAISTVFQPIFQVRGRDFIPEKLLDIGMILVFTLLMLMIVAGTTAGAFVNRVFRGVNAPGITFFVVGTAVSLASAFMLFAVIYSVFPNVRPRFKRNNVWRGAVIAAVLSQILTYIFPLYAQIGHFRRYGALLFALVVLTTWIYFFSLILVFGAEFVAYGALRDASRRGEPIGPSPDGTVPQRISNEDEEARRIRSG